jgi:hypothetical protein
VAQSLALKSSTRPFTCEIKCFVFAESCKKGLNSK